MLERRPGQNGLRIWVDADAVAKFQTVLGVLRSWRADAGERQDEALAGLWVGSVVDESGNQTVFAGCAVAYAIVGDDLDRMASAAREGIRESTNLANALWLNGRANRTAADYHMIYEYAEMEFGGSPGIRDALDLSPRSQGRFTQSTNNLSPLSGGRHADRSGETPMSLAEQCDYAAELLRRWVIRFRSV